jgi:hypothetical protein
MRCSLCDETAILPKSLIAVELLDPGLLRDDMYLFVPSCLRGEAFHEVI